MPIEPVKIPQNVYVEDRIIGPITLRQLIIVGIGTAISYVIYATVAKQIAVSVPLAIVLWLPAIVSAIFAFIKINDLSLFHIILLMVEQMSKPAVRTWCPHPGLTINIVTRPKKENEELTARAPDATAKLTELTTQLETQKRQLELLTNDANTPSDTDNATKANPIPNPNPITAPVDKQRIVASGIDPMRSVDGLSNGKLSAFSHLFHPQH